MPRRPRCFTPGSCHHVIQRGNNRCDIFRTTQDYRFFLLTLAAALAKFQVALHGYVLMTNHIHLMLTTPAADAICLMMQAVGRRYVYYFNHEHQRTGALFEGRYRACPIESEEYWYTCLRYVETNPVRAGMVATADEYRWSSARAHALGDADDLLSPHPLYLRLGLDDRGRQRAWREICGAALTAEQLHSVRESIQRPPTLSRPVYGV